MEKETGETKGQEQKGNEPEKENNDKDPDKEYEYVKAIKVICGFLEGYTRDKSYPAYGFGAKIPPYYNTVSNCFALNFNYFQPEIKGLDRLLDCIFISVHDLHYQAF